MSQSGAVSKDIVRENAELIHRAVMAIAADQYIPDLEKVLAQADLNGWTSLVEAIRKILEGERDLLQLTGLDEEDRTIVTAILEGVEDPSSLPDLTNVIDPGVAGPSMAQMIHDAATGNYAATDAIKALSEQMRSTGGDFSRILTGGDFSRIPDVINCMVRGERQEEVLCKGLGTAGVSLVQAILEELKKLDV